LQLDAVAVSLEAEAAQRRRSACTRIAELLVDAAAMRRTAPAAEFDDSEARQRLVAALQKAVFDKAQRCADDLLSLHGFREGDADEAPLPMVQGRWSMDFFHPEALKDAGVLLGKGVAVGAAVGVVADLALAGLSLGAGAALGGAIGGALSQGWGPVGRKLANRLRDLRELTVEDRVLVVLANWQLALLRAVEARGHAAIDRIAAPAQSPAPDAAPAVRQVADIVRAVRPARSHPDWETGTRLRWREAPQREELVRHVAGCVARAAEDGRNAD